MGLLLTVFLPLSLAVIMFTLKPFPFLRNRKRDKKMRKNNKLER